MARRTNEIRQLFSLQSTTSVIKNMSVSLQSVTSITKGDALIKRGRTDHILVLPHRINMLKFIL